MNKPWNLIQRPKWPFPLEIVDANGEKILQQDRYAYSSKDKTVSDVLECRHFKRGEEQDSAAEGNRKQMAQLQHIVDCVNK